MCDLNSFSVNCHSPFDATQPSHAAAPAAAALLPLLARHTCCYRSTRYHVPCTAALLLLLLLLLPLLLLARCKDHGRPCVHCGLTEYPIPNDVSSLSSRLPASSWRSRPSQSAASSHRRVPPWEQKPAAHSPHQMIACLISFRQSADPQIVRSHLGIDAV